MGTSFEPLPGRLGVGCLLGRRPLQLPNCDCEEDPLTETEGRRRATVNNNGSHGLAALAFIYDGLFCPLQIHLLLFYGWFYSSALSLLLNRHHEERVMFA